MAWQCQHKAGDSPCLPLTRLQEPAPAAGLALCVSLHHAALSVSGGRNTKSFNSSTEAVFLSVQPCPKAADV